MVARYGCTCSNADFGPDATDESLPALTHLPLPLTGALTKSQPNCFSRARIASDCSIPIDEQSTRIFGRGPSVSEEAVLAEIDLFEILASRDHREHDLLAGKLVRVIDDPSALFAQRLGLGTGSVPDRDRMACLEQALGHRIAHASHADPAE